MRPTSPTGWLVARVWLGLTCLAAPAVAQQPSTGAPSPSVVLVDPASLDRIRKALNAEPDAKFASDLLRFYGEVTVTEPTFADYLKGSGRWFDITTTGPPSSNRSGGRPLSGGGIDLGALFGRWEKALDNRKARKIREQIDRELEAIDAVRTGAPPNPASP